MKPYRQGSTMRVMNSTSLLSDTVLADTLPPEPLQFANEWLAEAWQRREQPNPNAMVLATSTPDGRPSARVVLCKEVVVRPGYIVFYTNYLSRKGRDLAENPRAAVVLHWDHLHRQVRIEGLVERAPAADSDAYFASRPWQSRVGAWASAQSEPIASRADLLSAVEAATEKYAGNAAAETDVVVPRPPHWGGYQLWAEAVELWVEGQARIHDRARWTRQLTRRSDGLLEPGPWTVQRLQP
jgi:pyridoxamine 5'-phosphate oxidase